MKLKDLINKLIAIDAEHPNLDVYVDGAPIDDEFGCEVAQSASSGKTSLHIGSCRRFEAYKVWRAK